MGVFREECWFPREWGPGPQRVASIRKRFRVATHVLVISCLRPDDFVASYDVRLLYRIVASATSIRILAAEHPQHGHRDDLQIKG